MKRAPQIILALESAIFGGSISLLRDGVEIANHVGSAEVSRAEDLLADIDEMLTQNEIARDKIGMIAVSVGPGSFTGIRIGIATALGLKAGLGIGMASESALKAMVFAQPAIKTFIAALPGGRNAICLQELHKSETEVIAIAEPLTVTEDEFLKLVEAEEKIFLLHTALYEKVSGHSQAINFGSNIARAIGLICLQNPAATVAPLFISKSF